MKYTYKVRSLIIMLDGLEVSQQFEKYPAGMIGCTNGLLVWVNCNDVNPHLVQYMTVGGMAFYLQKFYTSVDVFNTGYGFFAVPRCPAKFEDLRSHNGVVFFLVGYTYDEEVRNLLERISSPHYQEQVTMLVVAE